MSELDQAEGSDGSRFAPDQGDVAAGGSRGAMEGAVPDEGALGGSGGHGSPVDVQDFNLG